MTIFAAVRHSAPVQSGICYGQTDIAVKNDPITAANHILKRLSFAPQIIYTSPSLRCLHPAKILGSTLDIAVITDPCLYELNFGDWEGIPWEKLAGQPTFEKWAKHWLREAPPRGESVPILEARVRSWWASIPKNIPTLLVGHAGVIRALRVIIEEAPWDAIMGQPVEYLEPVVLNSISA